MPSLKFKTVVCRRFSFCIPWSINISLNAQYRKWTHLTRVTFNHLSTWNNKFYHRNHFCSVLTSCNDNSTILSCDTVRGKKIKKDLSRNSSFPLCSLPLSFFLGNTPLFQGKWMWWHSAMLLFMDLDGSHVSAEIGFSVPRGLKPLVFGDKCLLCGNTVWLTDTAQSLIPPLPPCCTWINHLHGKATVLRLELSSLLFFSVSGAEMGLGIIRRRIKYELVCKASSIDLVHDNHKTMCVANHQFYWREGLMCKWCLILC